MNDPRDPETEAQIRRALEARAEETIVSPDALDSIRTRRTTGKWARPATYAAVAALIVLIGGVAVLNLPDDDSGGVDSAAPTSTTTAPDTYPTTGPPDPSTTGDVGVADSLRSFYGPVTFEDRTGDAWVASPLAASGRLVREVGPYWPTDGRVFPDWDSVSLAYLEEVHGISDPVQITSVGYTVAASESEAQDDPSAPTGFRRISEAGEPRGMGMLIGAAADASGNWFVGQVATDQLWIDAVDRSAASPGQLRIRGGGTAFEGTAILTVGDSPPIIIAVGATSPQPFTTVVPWDGNDIVRVTLEAGSPLEGALPDVVGAMAVPELVDDAFAVPVVPYSVFGVADDDELNVRSLAGVSNDIIGSLTPDATGIIRTGAENGVGDDAWWEIETDVGPGWVNSRFLVANPDVVATPGLEDQLFDIITVLPSLDDAPFGDRAEFGGIGVYADWPTPWTPVDRNEFDVLRNWSPEGTEDRRCDCDMTVDEFLGFDTAKWDLAEYSTDESFAPAAFDQSTESHHFATGHFAAFDDRFVTATIYIPEPNPQESLDWRHYTVVFDFEDGSPVIRGIWRWGWTP